MPWYQKFEYAVGHWLQKERSLLTDLSHLLPYNLRTVSTCFNIFDNSSYESKIKLYNFNFNAKYKEDISEDISNVLCLIP